MSWIKVKIFHLNYEGTDVQKKKEKVRERIKLIKIFHHKFSPTRIQFSLTLYTAVDFFAMDPKTNAQSLDKVKIIQFQKSLQQYIHRYKYILLLKKFQQPNNYHVSTNTYIQIYVNIEPEVSSSLRATNYLRTCHIHITYYILRIRM